MNLGNYDGSYSLTTGGQTYRGSFTYAEVAVSTVTPLFNMVSTTDYPNSLTLISSYGQSWYEPSPSVVADVTASNGFHMVLSIGSVVFGGPDLFQWMDRSPVAVTATLVTATNAPVITNQPQPVVVHAYDTASFSVGGSGTIPLSYQWSFNGTNISGATLSSFTIPNVVPTNLGTYAVVVTNGVASVTSSNAMLSMYPFIAVPFGGAITYWGKAYMFIVGAWGTGPLNYQWYQNAVALQDATNATLSFASMQATNAGFYSVVVSSSLGSVTNPPAQVIVQPAGVSLGFCPALTINGVVGYSYIIQSSLNLTDTNAWVTLTNVTLTQPLQMWVDTSVDASSPFFSRYYYRVLPGQ
jgi:hypothetical protein